MKDALVVFADEAFWAGDKSAEGVLKAMVTEDDLPIEFKGKDTIFIRNHIRLMISSNHDWVVPAGMEERRFFVLDVNDGRMQDKKYFAAIIKQMDNGGLEALLGFLLNYDLEHIDLRTFPQTDALFQQKLLTMTPIHKWWFGRLMAGAIISEGSNWEEWVQCRDVQDDFINFNRNAGYSRRAVETELGMELQKLVPWLPKKRRKVGGVRAWVYEFPSLEVCRAAFDRLTRTQNDWPEEDD